MEPCHQPETFSNEKCVLSPFTTSVRVWFDCLMSVTMLINMYVKDWDRKIVTILCAFRFVRLIHSKDLRRCEWRSLISLIFKKFKISSKYQLSLNYWVGRSFRTSPIVTLLQLYSTQILKFYVTRNPSFSELIEDWWTSTIQFDSKKMNEIGLKFEFLFLIVKTKDPSKFQFANVF